MATHCSILAWRIPWTGAWRVTVHGVIESDMTEQLMFNINTSWGFPGGAGVKNLPANAGDTRDASSVPESERFPRGRNGGPLQYSCLKDSMNRGAWQATVHGIGESDMTEQLSTQYFLSFVQKLKKREHFLTHSIKPALL